MKERIVIVGAGRLGQALAHSLAAEGEASLVLWNRAGRPFPEDLAEGVTYLQGELPVASLGSADLVFLAVRDDALEEVAARVAPCLGAETILSHCSGVTPLSPLHNSGHPPERCGILHPLQAISSGTRKARLFAGVWVGVEGGEAPLQRLTALARQLGAEVFSLEGVDRALYHAAAVISGNYLVTLAALCEQIASQAGLKGPSLAPFLPLMGTALAQLQQRPPAEALTGPLARGDGEVVATHFEAIQRLRPEWAQLYAHLAEHTLPLVQGGTRESQERNERLLQWLREQTQQRS